MRICRVCGDLVECDFTAHMLGHRAEFEADARTATLVEEQRAARPATSEEWRDHLGAVVERKHGVRLTPTSLFALIGVVVATAFFLIEFLDTGNAGPFVVCAFASLLVAATVQTEASSKGE